jgi:hypothetical protein
LTLSPAGKVPNKQVKLLAEVQASLAKEDILLVKVLVTNKSVLEVQYGEALVLQAIQELETSLSALNSVAKLERVSPVLIAMQAKDPSNSLGFMQGVRAALRGINTSGS